MKVKAVPAGAPDARHGFWFIALGLAGSLAAAFFLLTSEVNEARQGFHETIGIMDRSLNEFFIRFRTAHQASLDPIVIPVTWLGSGEILATLIVASLGALAWRRRFWDAAYLVSVGAGAAVLIFVLKVHYARPRPEDSPWIADFTGFSYPSGHATGSSAVFGAMVLLLSAIRGRVVQPGFAVFAFALYTAVAVSRIYLGAHYFSDVVAGGLLGTSWALFAWGVLSWLRSRGGTRWAVTNPKGFTED